MAVAAQRPVDPAVAYAGLALSTFGWASAFIAGKVVLAEMTPLPAAAARYAAATVVLLPFALRRERGDVAAVAVPLGLMVVCGGVLYPWLFLLALRHTTATNTSLLIALNPVFTMLLAPLVGERLDRRRLTGVLLALAGAATVITAGQSATVDLAPGAVNLGDAFAVTGAACWALFNLASRRVVAHLSPALTNCIVYGIGSVAMLMLGRGEHPFDQLRGATPLALGGLLSMALLSSVVAGQFFLVGVRSVGVGRTVVFVYFVPVVTALLSVTLLGEPFRVAQAVGGACVLTGIWWTTRTA